MWENVLRGGKEMSRNLSRECATCCTPISISSRCSLPEVRHFRVEIVLPGRKCDSKRCNGTLIEAMPGGVLFGLET
jgi:hypothetical protein